MKEVLQFAAGRLSPAVAEDLADLLELLHDKEVRRYLCDDSLLPREAVAEMLTQSAQLDSRGLGLWMIELPDGSTAGGCRAATGFCRVGAGANPGWRN